MKKMNKLFTFISMFAIAMVLVGPVIAYADVTVNVAKPLDWSGINVHAWTKSKGDLTTWPGTPLTQNGDKFTVTISADNKEKISLILNDGGSKYQTVNIDGLTCSDGKGAGLENGSYDITITSEKDCNGKLKWTAVKTGDGNSVTPRATTQTTVAPTNNPAEDNQVPAVTSPKTADTTTVFVIGIAAMALLSGIVSYVTRKKIMG